MIPTVVIGCVGTRNNYSKYTYNIKTSENTIVLVDYVGKYTVTTF